MSTPSRSADPAEVPHRSGADASSPAWREPSWLRGPAPSRRLGSAGGPLVWWAVVVLLALLSFYVYVLQEQVWRAEQARQTPPLAAGAAPAEAAATTEATRPGELAIDLTQLPSALHLRVGSTR